MKTKNKDANQLSPKKNKFEQEDEEGLNLTESDLYYGCCGRNLFNQQVKLIQKKSIIFENLEMKIKKQTKKLQPIESFVKKDLLSTPNLHSFSSLQISSDINTLGIMQLSPEFSKCRKLMNIKRDKDGQQKLLSSIPFHQDQDLLDLEADSNSYFSNLSPRSSFIAACIREKLNPRSSLVIRQNFTDNLKLSHMGIGNNLAHHLAEALSLLPDIKSIDLTDNSLTDDGIVRVIKAISHIPNLTHLNLSKNAIGAETTKALCSYLLGEDCVLQELVLQHVNVDDKECCKLVEAIKNNNYITLLDLSYNKIGESETLNTVSHHHHAVTGGAALAEILHNNRCPLNTLILGWNRIRLGSAIIFTTALEHNHTVTHLDLSFNGLGVEGGQAIGNALLENNTLKTLLLSNNGINSTACLTICIGIIENQSLTKVVLDGNCVGEQGLRALMMIPLAIGNRVQISINGCNFDMKDNSLQALLDLNQPCKPYQLDLSQHYQRAVAFALLQIAADSPSYQITAASYNGVEIALKSYSAAKTNTEVAEVITEMEGKIECLRQAIANIPLEFKQMHLDEEDADADCIDYKEFCKLVEAVDDGFQDPHEVFKYYDINCCGTITLRDVISYLTHRLRIHTFALRELGEHPLIVDFHSQLRYIPPKTGILEVIMEDRFSTKSVYKVLSRVDWLHLLDFCRGAPLELSRMVLSALTNTKLRLAEALPMYSIVFKDSGRKRLALSLALPLLAETADANLLIAAALTNDRAQLASLNLEMGPFLRPLRGNPTGYYSLHLHTESHRHCLKRLVELSESRTEEVCGRIGHRLGDVSQRGDWSSFRNLLHCGLPIPYDATALISLPRKGILEFDFILYQPPPELSQELLDSRLLHLMFACGLLARDEDEQALEQLAEQKAQGDISLFGYGNTAQSSDTVRVIEVSALQAEFYAALSSRKKETETALIDEQIKFDYAMAASSARRMGPSLAGPNGRRSASIGARHQVKDTDSDLVHRDFQALLGCSQISDLAKAARLLDHLSAALSRVWLVCRQLAVLARFFVLGERVRFGRSSYRVELVIVLFTRLLDLHNFEFVMSALTPIEAAAVLCRVGYLTLFNPLKPEGCYELDLSYWDCRQVAKMLLSLSAVEPGEHFQEASFRLQRQLQPVPGFELNKLWLIDSGVPIKGILRLKYVCEEGSPVVAFRRALTMLTQIDELWLRTDEQRAVGWCDSRQGSKYVMGSKAVTAVWQPLLCCPKFVS